MKWDWDKFFIKLTSRKLWVALAGLVGGLLAAGGWTESEIAQVTGVIMSLAAVVAYIVGEGLVDAKREDGEANQEIKQLQPLIGFNVAEESEE